MQHRPHLDLRMHKNTGELFIQNYAIRPVYGGNIGWGPLVRVTTDDLRMGGTTIILDNLRDFAERDGNRGSETLSRDEHRKFDREHSMVGIRQETETQLILSPMHRGERGGFIGSREEEIMVDVPCTPETFYEAVLRAFEKAD